MKYRLDQLLVKKNLIDSCKKAKSYILAGKVLVNNFTITKVGSLIEENSSIRLKHINNYVSRGGNKLEKVIKVFKPKIKNKIILDIGASTGGFTHCLLNNGAKKVYSVDVGYNQLSYILRKDIRVCSLENINAKYLTLDLFNPLPEIAFIDVSFISLTKILKSVLSVLDQPEIIALIKPQFEINENIPNFKGIVTSPLDHIKILLKINEKALNFGLFPKNLTYSPLKGPKGNIEFFIHWNNFNTSKIDFYKMISYIVKESHKNL